MNLEYVTLSIEYDIKNNNYSDESTLKRRGKMEIVDTFLREQIGQGKDLSEPEVRSVYHIDLRWYPKNDRIDVKSDTGNKGLRDGILMGYLEYLSSEK